MIDHEFLGRHIPLYARRVIGALGITNPPINAEEVADFLGYEVREITDMDIADGPPEIREILTQSPAHLLRDVNAILVNANLPGKRKRLSIFHECGHDQIPWHKSLTYACGEDYVLRPNHHDQVEREAFLCGTELMFPYEIFLNQLRSLPTGMHAIQALARNFDASKEATAIRYVRTHPGVCALVGIERCDNVMPTRTGTTNWTPGQFDLGLDVRLASPPPPFKIPAAYKVKYVVHSYSFEKYIPPGSIIPIDEPHLMELDSSPVSRIELPIRVLGSRSHSTFMAESLTLGEQSLFLVLLWIPARQERLWQ